MAEEDRRRAGKVRNEHRWSPGAGSCSWGQHFTQVVPGRETQRQDLAWFYRCKHSSEMREPVAFTRGMR